MNNACGSKTTLQPKLTPDLRSELQGYGEPLDRPVREEEKVRRTPGPQP